MDIGPILPRYIHKIIISFPAKCNVEVKSLERPTVAMALVVSNATFKREPPSTIWRRNVADIRTSTLTMLTAKALVTVLCGIVFLKTTRWSLLFIVSLVLKTRTASVDVLIPPAVLMEEPPINIRKRHIITVQLLNALWENVINPAVLKVTAWKMLAIIFWKKLKLPIVPELLNSRSKIIKAPPNISDNVVIIVILL